MIRLKLIDYREYANLEAGRVLYHDSRFTSQEVKVYVEYSFEYTYADNRQETKKIRQVFTVREERERNTAGIRGPNEVHEFVKKITVVIVNIEDATEAGSGQ